MNDASRIKSADRTVRVLGKGGKTRVVPVGRHAVEAISRWLLERTKLADVGNTALFVGKRGDRFDVLRDY